MNIKTLTLLALVLTTWLTSFSGPPRSEKQELLVCGDSQVLIVDYHQSRDSVPAVVWRWDARSAAGLPEASRKYFRSVDDSKAVSGGKHILISSSSGGVALVNRADQKVLFHTFVRNAHSIEMLPRNCIVVAGSTGPQGNCLEVYDLKQPGKPVFRDSLYSGHGVVWDGKRQKLYALGYDVLRQYALQNWNSAAPRLQLEKQWKIPGISGHDLQPSPDGRQLLLSEHGGVWRFDLESHAFQPFPPLANLHNIKSVGLHPRSGQVIYTLPEESWWTFHVRFLDPGRQLAFPGMRVYKARWLAP
ncbi:MAG: DUF6528 family protein [Adhaeribacter sp.]